MEVFFVTLLLILLYFCREEKDMVEELTTVLVVEDNSFSWEFFKAVLSGLGIVSEVARDGLEAFCMLEKKTFGLVFMDCQMPNMDGYEATSKIRAMGNTFYSIPIIGISATVTDEIRVRCFRSGMNDVIEKPVDIDLLKDMIDRYLPNQEIGRVNQKAANLDGQINFDDAVSLLCKEMKISIGEATNLLEDFFRISKQLILKIENASTNGNQADVAKYAHQIKGMASMMRLRKIQAIADKLEKGGTQMTWELNQLKKVLFAYVIDEIEGFSL